MLIGIESRAWDDVFSLEGFLAGPTLPGPRPPTEALTCGVFMRSHKGFSLIELLLVVSVILIIAAIAVPNFLKSRLRANEASAAASLRVINTAALTYSITYPDIGFPAQLTTLGGANPCSASSTQACLVDDSLSQGNKSGYSFVLTGDGAVPSVSYIVTGTPQAIGSSGQRMFCTDQTSVIHYDPTGSGCTNASLVLE
jgi:type IV pilus assembly protein PilA